MASPSAASSATRVAWAPSACASRSLSGTSRTRSPSATPCAASAPWSTWPPRLATSRAARSRSSTGLRPGGWFVFFSVMGASTRSRARFFRAKALAERAVVGSGLQHTVFAPSIIYSPGDPWMRLLERMSLLPVMPVSGSGRAAYQPIWADDVADCVVAALDGRGDGRQRFELAGPDTLTYDAILQLALQSFGRRRQLVHVPLALVRAGLRVVGALAGPAAFATWDEAELMEIPMTTPSGTADAERLGV